jgi:hypothetical protein
MSPQRTPRFVSMGETAPAGSLAVDGAVPGAAAIYSHWQGDHTTPEALAADTSTGMLVRAACEEGRWLDGFAVVCNNHIDADGLLSVLCACRPDLARIHAPRLIAAATAGDFTQWTGAVAYDLLLRVHQHIALHQSTGPGWEQRCLDALLTQADELLTGEWPAEDARRAAIAQVEQSIRSLPSPTLHGRLAVMRWRQVLGHATDTFLTVFRPDDLPLIALSTCIPPDRFQLLIQETADGCYLQLDAPRHSWARTVDLPTLAWPDCTDVADALAAQEPPAGWIARPQAAEIGFTCLLACRRPSRIPVDELVRRVSGTLAGHGCDLADPR